MLALRINCIATMKALPNLKSLPPIRDDRSGLNRSPPHDTSQIDPLESCSGEGLEEAFQLSSTVARDAPVGSDRSVILDGQQRHTEQPENRDHARRWMRNHCAPLLYFIWFP